MTIVAGLRRARHRTGLSLTALASRSGVAASNLSTIEHARRDPTAGTIDRLTAALGITLIPAYTGGRATAADTADAIAAALTRGDTRLAYRMAIQLADDLATADPYTRALLAAEPPGPTAPGWDALLAGLTEWRLDQAGLPSPAWATATTGTRTGPWQPPGALLPARTDRIPAPLLTRGVLIEADEFASA